MMDHEQKPRRARMDDIMTNKKTSERIREWVELLHADGINRRIFLNTMSSLTDDDFDEKKEIYTTITIANALERLADSRAHIDNDEKKAAAFDSFCGKGGDMSKKVDCSDCPLAADGILFSLCGWGCLELRDWLDGDEDEGALRAGLELALCYEEAGD